MGRTDLIRQERISGSLRPLRKLSPSFSTRMAVYGLHCWDIHRRQRATRRFCGHGRTHYGLWSCKRRLGMTTDEQTNASIEPSRSSMRACQPAFERFHRHRRRLSAWFVGFRNRGTELTNRPGVTLPSSQVESEVCANMA